MDFLLIKKTTGIMLCDLALLVLHSAYLRFLNKVVPRAQKYHMWKFSTYFEDGKVL